MFHHLILWWIKICYFYIFSSLVFVTFLKFWCPSAILEVFPPVYLHILLLPNYLFSLLWYHNYTYFRFFLSWCFIFIHIFLDPSVLSILLLSSCFYLYISSRLIFTCINSTLTCVYSVVRISSWVVNFSFIFSVPWFYLIF